MGQGSWKQTISLFVVERLGKPGSTDWVHTSLDARFSSAKLRRRYLPGSIASFCTSHPRRALVPHRPRSLIRSYLPHAFPSAVKSCCWEPLVGHFQPLSGAQNQSDQALFFSRPWPCLHGSNKSIFARHLEPSVPPAAFASSWLHAQACKLGLVITQSTSCWSDVCGMRTTTIHGQEESTDNSRLPS